MNHASQLSRQVSELSQQERSILMSFLERSWPEDGFRASLELTPTGFRLARGAHAWLHYGPQLNADLAPSRWADIAQSGIVWSDRASWLREKFTEDGLQALIATCYSSNAGVWGQVVDVVPGELPPVLVRVIVERLKAVDAESEHYVAHIGQRLAQSGNLSALRELSRRGPRFREALRPYLARAGDRRALNTLLRRLRAALENGDHVPDDLDWLTGARDISYLPALFACLQTALEHRVEEPFGLVGALKDAIRAIGSEEAVRLYDEMIDERPFEGARWVLGWREEVGQDLLRSAGSAAVSKAASALGVPLLRGDGEPTS